MMLGIKRFLMQTMISTSSSLNYTAPALIPDCPRPRAITYIFCDCGRKKQAIGSTHCSTCQACVCVLECAQQQKLSEDVIAILKPIVCSTCGKRFADKASLKVHFDTLHGGQAVALRDNKASFKSMSVEEIKKLLKARGLSTSGRKDILIRRLEGAAFGEL